MQSRREFLVTSSVSVAGVALAASAVRARAAGPLPASEQPVPPLPPDAAGPYEIVGSPYLRTSDARPLSHCRTAAETWDQMLHFRMPDDWRTRLLHGF